MNLDKDAIFAAIDQSRQGQPVYCELDKTMKCEFFARDNTLRVTICLYRSAQRPNQLINIAHKRHAFADQYGDIKIGTDRDMNLYAGKTVMFISPNLVINEMENICDLLVA